MESQMIINIVLSALGTIAMFLLKVIWEGMRELQESDNRIRAELSQLHVLVAGDYVKKTEFDKMYSLLEKIYDKLDMKVDK